MYDIVTFIVSILKNILQSLLCVVFNVRICTIYGNFRMQNLDLLLRLSYKSDCRVMHLYVYYFS